MNQEPKETGENTFDTRPKKRPRKRCLFFLMSKDIPVCACEGSRDCRCQVLEADCKLHPRSPRDPCFFVSWEHYFRRWNSWIATKGVAVLIAALVCSAAKSIELDHVNRKAKKSTSGSTMSCVSPPSKGSASRSTKAAGSVQWLRRTKTFFIGNCDDGLDGTSNEVVGSSAVLALAGRGRCWHSFVKALM